LGLLLSACGAGHGHRDLLAVEDHERQRGPRQPSDVTVLVDGLDDQFARLQLTPERLQQFGERAWFVDLAALLRHVVDVARYVAATDQQRHGTARCRGYLHAEGPDD